MRFVADRPRAWLREPMPIGSLVAFVIVGVLWVATSLVLRHSLLHDETEHRPTG